MLKLYKSSAGSGKTFTLVKEYLKMCLPNPGKYKNIVAITFTNAAASEMKERILAKLEGLADGKEQDLRRQLLSEGLGELQVNNAGKVLENILRDYSRFNVSTIDSFFHKILRAFGKELGLPLDFEIFIKTDEALEYAVDTFLQRSNTNKEMHEVLMEFINEKVGTGRSWQIRQDLNKIAAELLKDDTFLMEEPPLEKIKKFIKDLRDISIAFENEMDSIGKKALTAMRDNGVTAEDFKYGKSGPANYFNKILRSYRDYTPGLRIQSVVANPDEWVTKKADGFFKLKSVADEYLNPLAIQALSIYETKYSRYVTAREVLRNIYTFSVYGEIQKLLMEYKAQNEVVLIADFNRILASHLVKEQMDFIYSKIGAKYEHFLIDEFQDTSGLQWLNLRPLIENAVAQGAECLLVGDSKQAIYRWRGGQVELIETTVTEIDFPYNSQKLSLNSNYRSSVKVVDFNNRFFKSMLGLFPADFYENELLKNIFEDVEQKSASSTEKTGHIEISFIEKEGSTKDVYIEKASDKLIYTIASLMGEGYTLRDITVLVRSNSEAEIIATLLFQNNLDFISPDSLFLDKSPSIRLLLSALHYLADTRNILAKTELLYIYLEYFKTDSTTDASSILSDMDGSIFEGQMPDEFSTNIATIIHLPLYDIVENLIKTFGLEKGLDPYIQRFRQVILEYTKVHKLSIHSFLQWWEEGEYSVIMPEDMNAIRIMTIHKSKGLEFPIVIMPFVNWNFNTSFSDIIWVSSSEEPFNAFEKLPVPYSPKLADSYFKEEYKREDAMITIDNLNLLYVAFTRPKERLYVFTEKLKTVKEISSATALLNKVFQKELESGNDIIFGS